VILKIDPASYLAIEGRGAPGGEEFQDCVGALYAAAYTLKFTSKQAGKDYVVSKLEGIWWADGDPPLEDLPPEKWRWKLLIRTPDFIGKAELKEAIKKVIEKGNPGRIEDVKLEKFSEGKCIQMLHVGPYDTEAETIEKMQEAAEAAGLTFRGRHHEVYLSDPRRVEPARLKTILRHPVS
jgi:hypothetical protein